MSESPSRRPDFADIYDRCFAPVFNYVLYRVGDVAAADEVVSRVFERALDRLDGYDPRRGPPRAWLFGIARNAVNDHFRARRWLAWLPGDLAARADAPHDDALVADEDRRLLLRALRTLDAREREVLALKFGGEMSHRDIASEVGLGESHVGVIVHRALKRLRAELGEEP
jgi:RNA polymerase sigma-70 factor (ECF subfamily)